MQHLPVVVARPFLPATDLARSRDFYEAIGFTKLLDSQVVIFSVGGAGGFILQHYTAPGAAKHFMMQLMVEDLDAWWKHIASLDLQRRFGVQPPKPPAMQPWGLEVAYLYDPAGVLWHVCRQRPGVPQDCA